MALQVTAAPAAGPDSEPEAPILPIRLLLVQVFNLKFIVLELHHWHYNFYRLNILYCLLILLYNNVLLLPLPVGLYELVGSSPESSLVLVLHLSEASG